MKVSWSVVIALALVCVLFGVFIGQTAYKVHVERVMYNTGYHVQDWGMWQVSKFGKVYTYTCSRCHVHFTSSEDMRK